MFSVKPRTFRSALLLVLLGGAMLATLVGTAPLVRQIYDMAQERAREDAKRDAERVAEAVWHEMVLLASRLELVSHDGELAQAVANAKWEFVESRYLKRFMAANTEVSAALVLDPGHRSRSLAVYPPSLEKAPFPGESWQRWIQSLDLSGGQVNRSGYALKLFDDEPYLARQQALLAASRSPPHKPHLHSPTFLAFAAPIAAIDSRQSVGLLVLIVPFGHIAECHLFRVQPEGRLGLGLGQRQLLTESDGSPALPTEGAKDWSTALSEVTLTHSQPSPLVLTVTVAQPANRYASLVDTALRGVAWRLALALLGIGLAAIALARKLGQPFARFALRLEAYGAGDYRAVPTADFGFEELRTFAKILADLGGKIEDQLALRASQERLQGELAKAQIEAELAALREQIKPHFMFNVLNAIATLVPRAPERAAHMVARLADLYRMVLEASKQRTVPLALELALVEAYLELQKMRFEERLSYSIAALPPALAAIHVPSLMVQGLVENAVKHGVAKALSGGWVNVSIHAEQPGRYVVKVANSGAPFMSGSVDGHGLSNSRKRLKLLYGEGYDLTLTTRLEDGATEACICISGEAK